MNRKLLIAILMLIPGLALTTPSTAATWTNDGGVGVNQLELTLQISCPAISFVCNQVDGYNDVRTSTLTGAGTLVVDADLDEITFDSDGSQDVGSGPQPAYLTMNGSDVTFAGVPLAGVPEIVNLVVFSVSSPAIAVPGLDLAVPGDYPFSTTLDYASLAEVTGDLEFLLPDLVVPPSSVAVTGTLRVLGDIDFDGMTELEIRDLSGSLAVQTGGTILGEPVTIDVSGVLSANLSGEAVAPQIPVPSLGPTGLSLLAGGLAALGWRRSRMLR